MRYFAGLIIVILSFCIPVYAQEKDTLVQKTVFRYNSLPLPDHEERQLSPELTIMPETFREIKSGFDPRFPFVPDLNFNLKNGWKSESGIFNEFSFRNDLSFLKIRAGRWGRTAWDYYQGTYGIRTYQVNDKFSIGTSGYSEKSFNIYSHKMGLYPQTNYGSSLFVGYKFSEKFSISAGFTIERNGDPLNRYPGSGNGGMFP